MTTPVKASLRDLLGGLGFHHHYTGVLTPRGTFGVDFYAALSPPGTVSATTVAGGTLASRTYFYIVTYVDGGGEGLGSTEFSQAIAANNLFKVTKVPGIGAAPLTATAFNVYAATTSGAEVLQTPTPIAIASSWTEPTTGLVTGTVGPPTVNTTGWQVFNEFVPDPVSTCTYITGSADTGLDDELRISVLAIFGFGFSQSGVPSITYGIDTWLTGQNDPGTFTPWMNAGYEEMRYIRSKLTYTPVAGTVCYFTDLETVIDTAPLVISGSSVIISPGGTSVSFSETYHTAPQVVATCISNTALTVSVTSVSATGCTFHCWNTSGADVGGTINYTATGE